MTSDRMLLLIKEKYTEPRLMTSDRMLLLIKEKYWAETGDIRQNAALD